MIRSSTLFIFLLLCGLLISSCSKEEPSFVPKDEIIMAQLKIGPSIEYEESPLSRTDSKSELEPGIYAINVFWKGKNLTSYQPYASGLFNDISTVKIGLIEGYEYRFDCTFLANNELPYSENGKYGRPFSLTKAGLVDAEITNKLKVSINPLSENEEFHQLIYDGDTQTTADRIVQCLANQHRYYGYGTIDFRTKFSSPTATIELKRAYHTLRFTTNKELKEKDSIKIITEYTDPFYITHSGTSPYTSDKRLLAMKIVSNIRGWGWNGEVNDIDLMKVSVYYRPAEAAEWKPVLENTEIKLQRNKNNILNLINIDTETQGNGSISFEEGETGGLPSEDNNLEL